MSENMLMFEATGYIMKKISDNHEIIKGLIAEASHNTRDFAVFNHAILNKFMGGVNTSEYKEIKEHKERNPKLKCAYYNYFDFETLCAYERFLTKVIEYARRDANLRGGRVTAEILNNAIDGAGQFLTRNIRKENMCYYKGYPVLARKENGYTLNPTKTPKMEIDDMKERLYKDYIYKYFNDKYKKQDKKKTAIKESPVAIVDDVKEDNYEISEDEYEEIEYSYNGKKLKFKVLREDYYFSEEGYPIRRVFAVSEYGDLIACLDPNNDVYCGNLYDDESNIVEDREESGELFSPSREFKELLAQERELLKKREYEKEPKTVKLKNGLDNYIIPGIDD